MKIEHEIKDVRIVLQDTIVAARAETGLLDETLLDGASRRIMNAVRGRRIWPKREERKSSRVLSEILHTPISREPGGERIYEETCALVSIEKEMTEHEFCRELAEHNCRPAGINEDMSYLSMLTARGVEVNFVFHLGTIIRTEMMMELRLLTKRGSDIELVPFHPMMKMKSYYHIIGVVKKEKLP